MTNNIVMDFSNRSVLRIDLRIKYIKVVMNQNSEAYLRENGEPNSFKGVLNGSVLEQTESFKGSVEGVVKFLFVSLLFD